MDANDDTTHKLNDRYPNFATSSTSKDKLQIRSVISIVDHKYKIEIVKNQFTGNSGTKGVVYLDVQDRGTTDNPVIIAHNTFTKNGGYIDGSAIYLRARGKSG